MAGKEMDEVEARIAELQNALDDLQHELGRLHETIDLIDPAEGDAGHGTALAGDGGEVIDLRGGADAPDGSIDLDAPIDERKDQRRDRSGERRRGRGGDQRIDLDDAADEDSRR